MKPLSWDKQLGLASLRCFTRENRANRHMRQSRLRPGKRLERLSGKEESIKPCIPLHVAYVCELQSVEDDCLTGGETNRSDLVSHVQDARCYCSAATNCRNRT